MFRLLIVDADADAMSGLGRDPVWKKYGFTAAGQAFTVRSAVTYLQKSGRTDLVVCRENGESPPVPDAAELTAALSGIRGAPACIVITPDTSPEKLRKCFLNGALDVIPEPVSSQKGHKGQDSHLLEEAVSRAAAHIKRTGSAAEYLTAVEEYFDTLEETVEDKAFLRTLKEFISSKEGEVVTTRDAAEYFGFNTDYFGRIFRANTGMTFGELYKRFRMLYAGKLLVSGRYKVNEIAAMLGFATADYFSAEFRRLTGKRPLDVKRRR